MSLWISDHLISLSLFAAATVVWSVILWIRRPLDPPFIALERALDETQVKRLLLRWSIGWRVRAAVAVILDMILFMPLYVVTALALTIGFETEYTFLKAVNAAFGSMVVIVALVNFAEDVLLLVTLATRPSPMVVWLTRRMAGFKYGVLALAIVFALFRYEVYLHMRLREANFRYVLPALVAATLLVWFFVARAMSSIARQHPPLLALQLAPNWLAVKDVLERWGGKGRRAAQAALAIDSLLAVLYGLTLATIFYRLHLKTVRDEPVPEDAWSIPGALAWMMLIAAACQLAQNLGASVAVSRRGIGWWVHPMRKAGKTRLYLLGLMAGYVVWLLVAAEGRLIWWIGKKITGWMPEIALPWS